MDKHKRTDICEINYSDSNWMIKLGKFSRIARCVVVKNFSPDHLSIGFVKRISSDHNLFVRSWDEDLVLEKRKANF